MGVKTIDVKLCNGCGFCVQDCPSEVFKIDANTGKAYLAYPEDCAECKLCTMWINIICPVGAIISSPNMAENVFFPYNIDDFPDKSPTIFKR